MTWPDRIVPLESENAQGTKPLAVVGGVLRDVAGITCEDAEGVREGSEACRERGGSEGEDSRSLEDTVCWASEGLLR